MLYSTLLRHVTDGKFFFLHSHTHLHTHTHLTLVPLVSITWDMMLYSVDYNSLSKTTDINAFKDCMELVGMSGIKTVASSSSPHEYYRNYLFVTNMFYHHGLLYCILPTVKYTVLYNHNTTIKIN